MLREGYLLCSRLFICDDCLLLPLLCRPRSRGFFFFLEYTVHLLDLANVCIGVLATMLSDSMLNRIRLLVRYKVVFNRIYKIYLGFIGILLEHCYLSPRKKQKLVLKKGEQQNLLPCML